MTVTKTTLRTLAYVCAGAGIFLFGSLSSQAGEAAGNQVPKTDVDEASLVALGRTLFNDKTLSDPPGLGCVSCHSPETGFSYPLSYVNSYFGTVPGAVKGRFGDRKPPSLAYAPYLPTGLPHFDPTLNAFVGGLFWDGRVPDAIAQAKAPFLNPNEMNNRVHGLGSPASVISKIKSGPTGAEFRRVYGDGVFTLPTNQVYDLMARAIVAYEASPEVSPFTSKYDAYLEGKVKFNDEELMGMRFVTGTMNGRPGGFPFKKSAHCMDCHALSNDLIKERDVWTNSCYANLGVPKNPLNMYYGMTDVRSNPHGANRFGKEYVDLGLGGFLYPYLGLLPGDFAHDDPLRINGTFKAPSLRNVDKRPYPGFVKAYMHNGVFKSLKDVVHFYNSRNLTTVPGEVIDFTKPDPYAGLKGKPLWQKPEYCDPNTLINPTGMGGGVGSRGVQTAPVVDLDAMQIGNLLLTEEHERAIVAFLKTLTDGYFKR